MLGHDDFCQGEKVEEALWSEHDQVSFPLNGASGSPNNSSSASGSSEDAAETNTSCWKMDMISPMTSRPHFRSRSYDNLKETTSQHDNHDENDDPEIYPMRRVRSRSLGSAAERQLHHDQHLRYDLTKQAQRKSPQSTFYSCLPISTDGDWQNLWITNQPSDRILATPRLAPSSPGTPTILLRRDRELHDNDDHPLNNNLTPNQSPRRFKKLSSRRSEGRKRKSSRRNNNNETSDEASPFWISCLYGSINATIVLPVIMSFASIIYREQDFAPYMPLLIKLTTISGVVHQLCFSSFSSLPFAVGQVQDAGLIFLSSMATYIVRHCNEKGHNDEVMLATTTICLSLGTAFLGLGLLVIGQCGLAQHVQMLPTSVVGGYLAFIGWFCGMAGIGLMAGESTVSFQQITQKGTWHFVVPGVFGGIFIYGMVRWLRHMAVLPTSILALLLLFYVVLVCTGASIDDVTDQGWIRSMDEQPHWTQTWDYLRFDLVDWDVLPHLVVTEVSMIFVVAMSSSLDVAAIELELRRPLNYNGELQMVGLSNLVSGLTGGYTGSYIFSQSIFSLRAGIRSRAAGYVLAGVQTMFFLVPFPIMAYIPNFFFGSLLSMICVDLMYEWLWDVRHKVTPVEYLICLGTFASIQVLGVEFGILLGLVVYLICQKIGLRLGAPRNMTTAIEETEEVETAELLGTPTPESEGSRNVDDNQATGYGAIK
mmetsp:Transcript_19351/g.41665  ORF Transcript_19351/g.41665 Transcript_19351/m.41665 type:complete len:708 (+) Transcript_19351:245-2368(+)